MENAETLLQWKGKVKRPAGELKNTGCYLSKTDEHRGCGNVIM